MPSLVAAAVSGMKELRSYCTSLGWDSETVSEKQTGKPAIEPLSITYYYAPSDIHRITGYSIDEVRVIMGYTDICKINNRVSLLRKLAQHATKDTKI